MERTRRPWLALAVLCLGTFAVLLDIKGTCVKVGRKLTRGA
jgi:hypothetical protein